MVVRLRSVGRSIPRRARPALGRVASAAALAFVAVAGLMAIGAAPARGGTTGSVSGFGDATAMGSPAADHLAARLVDIVPTHDGKGYWLLGADGGVFSYGDAGFFGSMAGSGSQLPVVGLAALPTGTGYWLVTDNGVVTPFGNASQYGSPQSLNAPVVGVAATPLGKGYWLAAADGGIFSYGDAGFYGSMGGTPLNQPVVGMAAAPTGKGYWLVAADGGVFSFGTARFYGSMGGTHLNAPVVGMAAAPTGKGYWLVAADGGIFSFGAAKFEGSLGGTPPGASTPVVAMAGDPAGEGYWVTTSDRPLAPSGPVPSVLDHCNLADAGPAVQPSTIMLACGDGDAYLNHLTWSSWTLTDATGTGDYAYNLCTPDCAQGRFASEPASVRLGYPIESGGGREFAELIFSTSDRTYTNVIPTIPG